MVIEIFLCQTWLSTSGGHPLQKHAHVIQRFFLKSVKIKKKLMKVFAVFLIFLLKTLIVGTR